MSWVIVRAAVRCSFCPVTIKVGEPARFGDRVPGVVWCQACAKSGFLREDPPASLLAAPERPTAAEPEAEPEPQPSLFNEPVGRRFKSYDARQALDELRKALPGADGDGAS